MNLVIRAVAILLAVFCLSAWAEGDPAAGQAKAALCAACHGADGNSMVPNWPKIAGQHSSYLERQIHLIKDGSRSVPEMVAFVGTLSDQDIADLAAFYSSSTIKGGIADDSLVAAGQRIYRGGNADSGVPACMACHGPAGEGNPLSVYPALAGQHSVYTAKMLTAFRDGANWGDDDSPSHVMNGSAGELTDAEIKAVASYIQGLFLDAAE
jgi:cytochrome c553